MDLIRLEHKKLWRKTSVKISVLLFFIYTVVIGNILVYQWFTFGSSNHDSYSPFGNNFDGYSMIKESQEYSRTFGGTLTDETLQKMVSDYQTNHQAAKAGDEAADRKEDQTDWQIIDHWISGLYPELKDADRYQIMISYVAPEKLTGFYDRRTQAIEDFLAAGGQTGAEREYLMQLEEKVKKPFSYEYVEGWSTLLGSTVAELGTVLALFLAIILSPMFSGEWRDNTSPLLLTTKNGWKEIARAKIIVGLLFSVELFVLFAGSMLFCQSIYLGWTGWNMPIQTIKLLSIAPMNMLQAELYEYAFAFLGSISFAGVVLLISAAVKNNVFALLFSLAAVYGPMMIVQYLPFSLQKALDLLPLVGSSTDIFRTNTFCIFGKYIWSPYLLITVPVLVGMLCLPFTVRKWAKKLKK
ncbi:MAG: ABC transporter permease [Lachnospiraceae bacterium]|nr:ABC transporter permease [Lachnospiraceae bacterium]